MHPQIPDFQIVVSRPNIALSQQTIHQWKAYLFSIQIMYKSQFQNIDPYDWFCGPGSHMLTIILCLVVFGLWMSSAICLSLPRLNSKVKSLQSWLIKSFYPPLCIYRLFFSFVAAGEKIMKDLRVGVSFEPTYIYKLLALIKSSLSEKVSIMKTGLFLIKLINSGVCLGLILRGCPVVHIVNVSFILRKLQLLQI